MQHVHTQFLVSPSNIAITCQYIESADNQDIIFHMSLSKTYRKELSLYFDLNDHNYYRLAVRG